MSSKLVDRVRRLKIFQLLIMSMNNDKVFYAVGRGKEIGIYDSWKDCKAQTDGFCNAKYRKFYNLEEAKEFVNFWRNYSSPVKDSIKSENLMECEENMDNACLDSSRHNDKPVAVQSATENERTVQNSSPSNHHPSSLSPHSHLQSHSPCSRLFEDGVSQKDVSILALNLRLDSFEKRFDACLKDIGAMAAEISQLKDEFRKLRETAGSVARSSPKKGNDGFMQSTLNFASPKKSDDSDFGDGRKGKNLKRKLSRSGSFEDSKRFSDEDFLKSMKPETVDFSTFTLDSDDFVVVYTDGSATDNGSKDAKAGIGIWFGTSHPLNVARPVIGPATSITAEIQAARIAIQLATRAGVKKLKIRTDSQFVINCATKWIKKWKTNGWTLYKGGTVKNKKELEQLDEAMSQITVEWEKVAGHSNILGNESADHLANQGAARYKR